MVGPDFTRPDAPVSPDWMESRDSRISGGTVDYRAWWRSFNDPALDRIIEQAYTRNLSLKIAGLRVLEARAQLGISVGCCFPRTSG